MFENIQNRLKKAGRLLPVALLPVALLPFAAWAQAPVNDDCTTATALTVAATCTPVTTTNANATASAGAPAPGANCFLATTPISNDVWYTAVVPANGGLIVTTSAITGSSVNDTGILLYSGTCAGLTEIGCSDDSSPTTFFSSASATGLTPGATVYVRVWSFGTTPTGQFGICATPGITVPANDDPAGAITLPIGSTCTPVSGTNAGATTTTVNGYVNGTNPNVACGIAVSPKDVWYKFTTAASGTGSTAVTLTVTGAPAGYLRLFSTASGAAGPFTEIACASGGNNNTVSLPLTVSTLTPNTTYYVFVAGFGSADTQGAFTICAVATPSNDATVQAIYTLGSVSSYSSPVAVQAVIKNLGTAAAASRTATLTVSGATTYTNTQTVPAIPVGGVVTITFPGYPVTATTGTNTVTVALSADDVAANNTATTQQTLTAGTLSYTDPSVTTFAGGFGSSSTTVTTATFYSKYTTTATGATVTAVTPTFAGTAAASNNYQVLIVAASSTGTPGTVLYTSPARVRPLAGGPDVVAIPSIPVSGSFYVAARQLTTSNFGLAFQNESPLRLATFYASNDGTTFTDLSVAATTFRPALSVTLSTVLATRNEALAAAVNLYPNPAHQSFKLDVPAGSLHNATAQLSNALGQVVLTRQLSLPTAGGSATFDVSRLAAGIYSLQLKAGSDIVVKRVVVE